MLICENLTVAYDGNIVLKNVSFKISRGQYVTVIGENGSGKTTLFKAILKEIQPLSGNIFINSNGGIGYLPQNISIDSAFPSQVFEIVLSGFAGSCGLRPFYSKEQKSKAEEILRKLGIVGLKNKYFNELSGGQKQRVLLARALCATDNFLMLDEPVASLDTHASAEFYELIQRLNKEDGVTILMISHDPSAVESSDSVLILSEHSAILKTKDEYFSQRS